MKGMTKHTIKKWNRIIPSGTNIVITAKSFINLHENNKVEAMTGIYYMDNGYTRSLEVNIENIYVYADKRTIHKHVTLDQNTINNIFKNNIPNEFKNKKEVKLFEVIDFLDNDFKEWIENNCEFKILEEQDVTKGSVPMQIKLGEKILTSKGAIDFNTKKIQYQNMIQQTKLFTYDFNGGITYLPNKIDNMYIIE